MNHSSDFITSAGRSVTRRAALGAFAGAASTALASCAAPRNNSLRTSTEPATQTVRILVTSDLHGKFLPFSYPADEEDRSGSVAQVATAIAELRNEHTLLIDVGDAIQDNMAEIFTTDEVHPMVLCLNELGYDYGVLGNHEFNYGLDVVRKTIDGFAGTVLTGNVADPYGIPLTDSFAIVKVGNVRVGIIGMVTPNITRWDATNLAGCAVTNPIDETHKIITQIQDHVDVLIAACHMSVNNEFGVPGSGVSDLAQACPELDVILAAHEHVLVEGELIGNALVVENKAQGQSLQCVDITCTRGAGGWSVTDKSSQTILTAELEPDPAIVELMAPYDERAKAYAREQVGLLAGGPLAPESEIGTIPTAIIQDTALTDLINLAQQYYTNAEISCAQVLTLDANIQEGIIRRCDVSKAYRDTNTLYTLRMTGAQLRDYMEWSASAFKQWQPEDLTLAFMPDWRCFDISIFHGITYTLDVSMPVGERIGDLAWPDGTPVAHDNSFVLAVNNYEANSVLLTPGVVFEEGNLPELLGVDIRNDIGGIRELITDYIENVCAGYVTATASGNWRIIGNDWNPELHNQAVELVRSGQISLANETDDEAHGLCTKVVTEADLYA